MEKNELNELEDSAIKPHHRLKEITGKDQYLQIRQVLDIIFMMGPINGFCIFYFSNQLTGTVIILAAMVFKIAECAFRFFR